ncbi:MAG: ATP-dependent helicase [Bacillota bacterium]|nr:ATP-dependent helicase [Bacillota bacterium]
MKTAIYKAKHIHLDTLDRGQYQKVFLAGKNGDIICPSCSEKLRLYLGIEGTPHFYHLQSPDKTCPDWKESFQPIVEEPERDGFILPKSRAITLPSTGSSSFEPLRRLETHQPLQVKEKKTTYTAPSFLKDLQESGVNLDESQAKAVMDIDGPLLVLAGAGSGKTRVLTVRSAYMLEVMNINPSSMMLVTFTSKAAAEMKKRLLAYPDINRQKVNSMVAGTFHSIFYRILMFHSPERWSSNKLIKWDWQKEKIIKETGRELQLSEKEFAFDLVLQQISFWKNSMVSPHTIKPESEWEEKAAILYRDYENYKEQEGLFDFDDMLIGCHQLLITSPMLLEQYQERFHYFLIDEFQDINKVQYELIKLLAAKNNNVCAVGDDDQSIYSFRGSDPTYLLEFEKDFPTAKIVILAENYRSSNEIVSTANRIIKENKWRRPKKMMPQFASGQAPALFFPFDEEEEATMIVTDIQDKISLGANPADFAILYRTHAASRAIFERLATSNLPFKLELDAESFYERRTVKSLLSFLKLSLNEDDSSALSYILGPLFLKQSALGDIKAASILQDCTFLESLLHLKMAHAFQEKKLKNTVSVIRLLKRMTPLDAIDAIEKEIGFQDFLKKRGNEGNKLEKGSDDVKDLKVAAKNFTHIQELLDHAEHMAAMNKEIKNMGKHFHEAITLSTIHRAKGLEYSTVYILGAVDGSIPHDYALESLRNGDLAPLEEERRLLYVAVTRAKNQLYLSVPVNRRGKKANLSRFLTRIR